LYKLHLIRKYLLKRRIAWVALLAVTLCTLMVLVVFSVMDGWLETFENSFHGSTGDVVISATDQLRGFPYYQQIINRVRDLPGVAAAVPVVDNYGLLDIRGYGMDMVHVLGYPPDIGKVIEWPTLLHRQGAAAAAGTPPSFGLLPDVPYERQFERGSAAAQAARTHPGMIVTGPVVGMSHGQKRAEANIRRNMVELPASLTLLPVPLGEAVQSSSAVTVGFWIVDDAKSRVYTLDAQNVYVDFDELQRDLHMAGNPADASEPARCSKILVKAKPGTDLKALTDAVDRAAQAAVLAEDYDADRQPVPQEQRHDSAAGRPDALDDHHRAVQRDVAGGRAADLLHLLHDRRGEDEGHRHHQERRGDRRRNHGAVPGVRAGDRRRRVGAGGGVVVRDRAEHQRAARLAGPGDGRADLVAGDVPVRLHPQQDEVEHRRLDGGRGAVVGRAGRADPGRAGGGHEPGRLAAVRVMNQMQPRRHEGRHEGHETGFGLTRGTANDSSDCLRVLRVPLRAFVVVFPSVDGRAARPNRLGEA
jgi:hypothetical protein